VKTAAMLLATIPFCLSAAPVLAQDDPGYNGLWSVELKLKNNTCPGNAEKQVSRLLVIDDWEGQIAAVMFLGDEPVPGHGKRIGNGFKATPLRQTENQKLGICTERHTFSFKSITNGTAKKVNYKYTLKCRKNKKVTRLCSQKYKGRGEKIEEE